MTILRPRKPQLPTWMGEARRRLARYLEEGTFETVQATSASAASATGGSSSSSVHYKNPIDVYLNATRDQVAREAPYPIVPSMALPPGHAFAQRHPDGTPLLVYRDKKDPTQVRAFVNSCRHRGSPLLREKPAKGGEFVTTPLKAPLLTCPYHAWTYEAKTGHLRKIPGHDKAFDLLVKDTLGLQPLTCQEQAGLLWIGGDMMRNNNLWSIEQVSSAFEPFVYSFASAADSDSSPPEAAHKVYGYREWIVQANWQLVVETALESYHIKSLHHKTFNVITHSSCMASQYLDSDLSCIMTVPLRSFQSLETKEQEQEQHDVSTILEQTTTTSLIFPATLVTLVKRFMSFITIEPIDSTSSKVRSWALPHRYSDLEEDDVDELAKRDFNSIVVAVEEDWDCVEQIQKGFLTTGTTSTKADFVFGGCEGNNVKFLNNVGAVAEQLQQLKTEEMATNDSS